MNFRKLYINNQGEKVLAQKDKKGEFYTLYPATKRSAKWVEDELDYVCDLTPHEARLVRLNQMALRSRGKKTRRTIYETNQNGFKVIKGYKQESQS